MEFYQPRFWGLDPVFSARVKLNIVDILSLQLYPGFPDIYCIQNHPISTVHVMGDIVSVSKKNRLIVYEVDDGSGVLSCCQWRKTEDSDEGLFIPELGQLVSVFGRISEFREERQLKVSSMVPEDDPNAEPLHWLQTIHLKRTVYSKPFSLPPGVRCDGVREGVGEDTRDIVRGAVLKYLQGIPESKNRFTLSELRGDPELKSRCQSVMKDGDRDKLAQILMSVLSALPQEGVVIPAKFALKSMSGETVFEVFSESKHLFPAILDYIKAKQKTPNGEKFGVPENWIVQNLKQKETFSQIPTSLITGALEHLVEQSQIFPLGHRVYKTVV